ncbi:MAG: hypothetical protein AAF264_12225 [Pseudomonadota bacterium]
MSKLGPDMSDVARIGADHGYGTSHENDSRTAMKADRFDGRRRRPKVDRVQLNTRVPIGTKEMLDALAKRGQCSMQDALVGVIEEAFDRLPPEAG